MNDLGHQSSSHMFSLSSSRLLSRVPLGFPRGSVQVRCVLDQIGPRLAVLSSLNPVITTGNVIAAAAAVAGGGAAHSAVTSALAHVAVTAVAIASGACLSTKVDFLWPRVEEQPDSLILDGVDVTGYAVFGDEKVQKAIAFAKKAHNGQFRKTGDPYLTHCIHTGKILAALVPSEGQRAINTVVAGILHDVIDDTLENLHSVEEEFGDDVANLVAGVSKLSYINQLLRRHRRTNLNSGTLGPEEANKLRVMLLGMVDDPRVVLIKLADRLHNMRTIYALSPLKAQAVAQETLAVWCSLASRLGVWALKAELEDLCFAVLQPKTFQRMQAELASIWSSGTKSKSLRKLSSKIDFLAPLHEDNLTIHEECNDNATNMKDLLQAVLPFDLLLDRRKRTTYLNSIKKSPDVPSTRPKVVSDAVIALESLAACEEVLERELFISTSYIPGMEVTLSSRLKSLYSIYCKMKRKDIGIRQVYDARALRVVVGDKKGTLHGAAVKSCYSLLNIIHRLWTPIDGEFDDYIVNPKPSSYQSLHTAVQGPDNSPLEVQIRTQRMHEHAEFGLAAHWLYKETVHTVSYTSPIRDSKSSTSPYQSMEEEISSQSDAWQKVEKGGRELLVAVSFGLEASEAVADRRSSFQKTRWESYARLYKKVSDQWWCAPGHGDWSTCLERYTLCRDGIFHKKDQFQRLLPTFIQVIDLTEQEESEKTDISRSVRSKYPGKPSSGSSSNSLESSINNKVQLLRTMLQWEEQVWFGSTVGETKRGANSNPVGLSEVAIICWPHGDIMRMRSGSTAADAARRIGLEGRLVLLNGQLALPQTELKDGDIVEVRA
ncbi:hypothetical protein QJS10_CPB20g01166 [Acorus calamus]|uniref:GTP diphosphokinase n=1 Tax=Acorus calamus TaxID=4465 RepID=A0AAV9CBD6_ACOCL|nr:hypothetical protein QJS10_CPB20g01166 [Acorus calamus]